MFMIIAAASVSVRVYVSVFFFSFFDFFCPPARGGRERQRRRREATGGLIKDGGFFHNSQRVAVFPEFLPGITAANEKVRRGK